MLTPTHLVTAQTAFIATCVAIGHVPTITESLAAMSAALLPDLDARQSYVGRIVRPLSSWLEDTFGHRTMTHSLVLQVAAGSTAYFTLPLGYALAIIAGWMSHSIADMMTPAGVAWFWPSRVRCVLPGNAKYRMQCMSQGELWFLVIIGMIGVVLMPLAETGKSTTGLIRSAIGALDAARAEYDANKGEHAYFLSVKGRDNRSYRDIAGQYYIIGPWGDAGFLVDNNGKPATVCHTTQCDWYADHGSLSRGPVEITTTLQLNANAIHSAALAAALSTLEADGKVYLIGNAKAQSANVQPPVIRKQGDSITFGYATPGDVERLDTTLRALSVTVQWRTKTGKPVPEIALPAQTPKQDSIIHKWIDALS